MSKFGLSKKKSVEINGILNYEDMSVEINGESLPLKNILNDFDGYNIKIALAQEECSESPVLEDIEEDLGKFDNQ